MLYTINNDLAPYYKNLLLVLAPCFVSCFDEAFNYVRNNKWFDLHLIYSDEVKLQTARVYFDFQFMGHKSATDLIQRFKDVHHNLNYVKNLLQISADGPNVNSKLLKLVKEDRKIQDPSSPEILHLCYCDLHVMHEVYWKR